MKNKMIAKMGQKGQAPAVIKGIVMFVVSLIFIVAFLPVINQLVGHVTSGNLSNLSFSNMILLLLGMSGLLLVILWIASIVDSFFNGDGDGQILVRR